jgi:hypothetical protein
VVSFKSAINDAAPITVSIITAKTTRYDRGDGDFSHVAVVVVSGNHKSQT